MANISNFGEIIFNSHLNVSNYLYITVACKTLCFLIIIITVLMISGVQALEVCYENVLYKFTFDIDIDIDKPGRWGLTVEKLYNDRPFFIVVNQEV